MQDRHPQARAAQFTGSYQILNSACNNGLVVENKVIIAKLAVRGGDGGPLKKLCQFASETSALHAQLPLLPVVFTYLK